MDYNLSIKFYKVFYKNALIGREVANQTVPKLINKVEELQQMCRVCGCMDDGTFVALDAYQQFEFEPSICNYRILLQRSSLQFQFNTMPDLPQRICTRCAYKAKIFYLMTRQFVLGQNTMRSTVTKWYRDKFNVEPPELPEDRKQLNKQLVALTETPTSPAEPPHRQQFQTLAYSTKKPLTPVKELIKDCVVPKGKQLKRSISAETCLDEATLVADTRINAVSAKSIARRMKLYDCRTVRSTVNLKQNPNVVVLKKNTARGTARANQVVKQLKQTTARAGTGTSRAPRGNAGKAGAGATRGSKSIDGTETAAEGTAGKVTARTVGGAAAAGLRAARAEQVKTPQTNRECLLRGKQTENHECFVTPRVSAKRVPRVAGESPIQLAVQDQSLRPDMVLSKAQLQRRLQERRKQWR